MDYDHELARRDQEVHELKKQVYGLEKEIKDIKEKMQDQVDYQRDFITDTGKSDALYYERLAIAQAFERLLKEI